MYNCMQKYTGGIFSWGYIFDCYNGQYLLDHGDVFIRYTTTINILIIFMHPNPGNGYHLATVVKVTHPRVMTSDVQLMSNSEIGGALII